MNKRTHRPNSPGAQLSLGQLGKGVQLIAQAVFFIACGTIVVVYESFGKLFQTAYGKASPNGRDSTTPQKSAREKVKVRLLPIDDYSQLTIDQIISRLEELSTEELILIRDFETRQENRSAVLRAIDSKLAESR